MRLKNLVTTFFLFLTAVATLLAQSHFTPDLSGTWKLNLEKSTLPKGSKIQSETMVISCSGPAIHMQYMTDGKFAYKNYTADGKEKKYIENQVAEHFVKAQWKGSILVVETFARLKVPGQPHETLDTDRWILSGNGRTLTEENDVPRQKRVYDKLPN